MRVVLLWVALVVGAGCSDATPCLSQDQCAVGQLCLRNRCLTIIDGGADAPATSIAFDDGDFIDADWSVAIEPDGGSAMGAQRAEGGRAGSYRRIENTVSKGIVRGFHFRATDAYDPATGGAIGSVDFSLATVRLMGATQVYALALRQGEVWFWGPEFRNPETPDRWSATEQLGLGVTDFVREDGAHPDFTASGAPITFGIACKSATGDGTSVGGIDDWHVGIAFSAQAPVP